MKRQGLLLAIGAYLCWSLLSPGNEMLLRELDPWWMQAQRAVAAVAVALILWSRHLGEALQLLRRPQILLALFIGTFVSFALFSWSQVFLTAAVATLAFFGAPLWTAFFAFFMIGEKPHPILIPAWLGLLAGAWLVVGGGQMHWLGLGLAAGSGITWALYSVLLRKYASNVAGKPLVLASLLVATLCFVIVALASGPMPNWGELSTNTWVWLAIQVAFPTIIGIMLFQRALQLLPATQVNLFVGIELAGAALWASWLLGETLIAKQWLGIVIVILAVTGYTWMAGRQESLGEPGALQ